MTVFEAVAVVTEVAGVFGKTGVTDGVITTAVVLYQL
jgi:hypothetical protein